MHNRKKTSRSRLFAFITPENVAEHSHDIEAALNLPTNHVATLFSDEHLINFQKNIDHILADCINITKKFVENSMRFYGGQGEDVALYVEKKHQELEAEAQDSIAKLQQKRDQLIHEFASEIDAAREKIRRASGYNEAILLNGLKKNITLAVQQCTHLPDPHALDTYQNYHLEAFHKKLTSIIKTAKHHKKQLVHDIKKQIEIFNHSSVMRAKLFFLDKHDVNFTPAAYAIDTLALKAQNTANDVLKTLNSRAKSIARDFENNFFLQDHFQKISRTSSQAILGLQPMQELSRHKGRLAMLLEKDIDQLNDILDEPLPEASPELTPYFKLRDELSTLNHQVSTPLLGVLNNQESTEDAKRRLHEIEALRLALIKQASQPVIAPATETHAPKMTRR